MAYTCVRSMDTLYFPLREWCLLTAPWTGRNVSLDATARPATSPHLRRVGREVRLLDQLCRRRIGTTKALHSTLRLGRNRQWYIVYVYAVFLWTLTLMHRAAPCTGTIAATPAYMKAVMDPHVQPFSFKFNLQGHRLVAISFATVSIVTHVTTRSCREITIGLARTFSVSTKQCHFEPLKSTP